ncbi:MAG: methylmalonyl Co-A mutase-associated GTPase MeaB [Firmicutes bacterium]|nr:methylmalonyl Co-A mutase-associated GTPase MeaB [Bacillota bacterium]MBQ6537229.1 methylmalonyl Co-A mutase-associated GTPase MeaB [Bacillota bacterium]MBR0179824.1 methylmalonyl Co-A mutase-associated GTPase MeaB [Bacillota bacterium]
MPTDYDIYKPEWIDEDKKKDTAFASFVMTGISESNDALRLSQQATVAAKPPKMTVDDYVAGVLEGDRMKLSRAITMVESNAPKHFAMAQDIVQQLLPHTGKAVRIGITGVPGAGKSTIIEALGCLLCQQGHKVAVLAVDPSSSVTGGAILGDKTRMEQLSREKNAFIRPSPAGGTLGGVSRKSRETMLLCEAAGYDVILVETVGVGQSETTVRSMVDFFLVVVLTGAGDDLQGVKKGVIELADAILVNKADGDNKTKALVTRADYEQILHYLRPATEGWTTKAYTCSAYTGEGIPEIWDVAMEYINQMKGTGQLESRRQQQNLTWVREMTDDYFRNLIYKNPAIAQPREAIENRVLDGSLAPTKALSEIVAVIESSLKL